jgi:anti-sigma regulatory factor (Ser/Thr protein kinase)
MQTLAIITSKTDLYEKIKQYSKHPSFGYEDFMLLDEFSKAVEYMTLEMPELVFIDFSDPIISSKKMLAAIKSDPWMLHGGIIALCENFNEAKNLENIKGINIIVALPVSSLGKHIYQIMNIINNNRRILFQREISSDLVWNFSGSFKMNNDPIEAKCYANLICNFLYNCNRLSLGKKRDLNCALTEMLMNAIEHGNCGISFDKKSEWLENDGNIFDLIRKKCEAPEVNKKKVTFEYSLLSDRSKFFVADEGDGFDWKRVKDVTQDDALLTQHGRGILLARQFTKNLTYNKKGNEVSFEIDHQSSEASITPGLFKNIEPLEVKAGEIIFQQGDPGSSLYYIVKGQYTVLVNGKTVSSLTADDVIMGEMSYLLNNRRNATVIAEVDGKIIEITKRQFVEAVKKKPHYALFLSRLLAQRIERLNFKSASLK